MKQIIKDWWGVLGGLFLVVAAIAFTVTGVIK